MISTLQKELELHSAKILAIHRQYTSQTELCKRLELREKTLSQQIVGFTVKMDSMIPY